MNRNPWSDATNTPDKMVQEQGRQKSITSGRTQKARVRAACSGRTKTSAGRTVDREGHGDRCNDHAHHLAGGRWP